jgi:hypothetical protein
MEDKKITKHFDFVIKNLDDETGFSINNTLFDSIAPETSNERYDFLDLCDSIKSFGKVNNYWEQFGKDAGNGGYFKLTEKGLDLRRFGKGHKKFDKKSRTKPLDWYKIIGLIFTFIFGISTIYYANNNYNLNLNKLNLEKENADLKIHLDSYNSQLNRVNSIPISVQELPLERKN